MATAWPTSWSRHAGMPGLCHGVGGGLFFSETPSGSDATGSNVALADLDGDGLVDLLARIICPRTIRCRDEPGRRLRFQTTYNLGVTTIGGNFLSIRTGDGDGDGDIDVLAVTAGAFGQPAGEARMFRNLGDGTLGNVGAIVPMGGFSKVVDGAVLSLTNDLRPDLVVVYESGVQLPTFQVVAAVCNVDGTFTGTASFSQSKLAATGDLDGDGDTDLLLLAVPDGLGNPPPSLVTSQLNLGNGSLATGPSWTCRSRTASPSPAWPTSTPMASPTS